MTCHLMDNLLPAFSGNCVTFRECWAHISGNSEAKSTPELCSNKCNICYSYDLTTVQSIFMNSSSSKNKRAIDLWVVVWSRAVTLSENLNLNFFLSKWAFWHCGLYCFEKEDEPIAMLNRCWSQHFVTQCPSAFAVNGAGLIKNRQVSSVFVSSLGATISWT